MSRVDICTHCHNSFQITDTDRIFLEKLSPSFNGQKYLFNDPVYCPRCRQQRRLAWRAERHLYQRKCDLTGKIMISIFAPDFPYKVYSPEAWFSDDWDATDYGQDYDFDRLFMDQYREVQLNTPKLGLIVLDNENSPYVSQSWHLKNCYLCYDNGYCEDVYFAYSTYHSKNSVDITRGENLELCYECISCSNCYNCVFLQDCHNCHDSYFSYDCQGSRNILFCSNLRNQECMIENKKVSPEEFSKALEDLNLKSYEAFQITRAEFIRLKKEAIHRENHNVNCENCVGDYLSECKNCWHCFEGYQSEDCRYVTRMDHKVKDTMDVDHTAEMELGYNGVAMAGYQSACCYNSVYSENVYYSDILFSCKNCFGCSSLNKKEYCILNKQYSRAEYEELVPKIISQMMERGEWGQFFDPKYSLFGYNQTLASERWPLSRDEAMKAGYLWSDYEKPIVQGIKSIPASKLPDNIDDTPDDVLSWALECVETGQKYKIIERELKFYRQQGLALPRVHPDQRHMKREELRNPRELYANKCVNCSKEIMTSYSRESSDRIFCVDCYLSKIY